MHARLPSSSFQKFELSICVLTRNVISFSVPDGGKLYNQTCIQRAWTDSFADQPYSLPSRRTSGTKVQTQKICFAIDWLSSWNPSQSLSSRLSHTLFNQNSVQTLMKASLAVYSGPTRIEVSLYRHYHEMSTGNDFIWIACTSIPEPA